MKRKKGTEKKKKPKCVCMCACVCVIVLLWMCVVKMAPSKTLLFALQGFDSSKVDLAERTILSTLDKVAREGFEAEVG